MAALVLALAAPPPAALAQDMTSQAFWDDIEKRTKEQQAEQARLNEEGARQAAAALEDQQAARSNEGAYTPNTFVSFPPEAWVAWVEEARASHQQQIEDRFGDDPAYKDLLRGVWTYYASDPKLTFKACAATFWTRGGGVSFVHLGGDDDYTLLGFFGATIPVVKRSRVIRLQLLQSGEMQEVTALNLNFDAARSLGMVLFNVRTPETLINAIEDTQDFEIMFNGETIAKGAWHSGLAARGEMLRCLKQQGYRLGK